MLHEEPKIPMPNVDRPPVNIADVMAEVASCREHTGTLPKILIVDDDPVFGRLFQGAAASCGVRCQYIASAEDTPAFRPGEYDLVVVDYDLGAITGIQLGNLLDQAMPGVPVLLVSGYLGIDSRRWGNGIKGFVTKQDGVYAILIESLRIFRASKLEKLI